MTEMVNQSKELHWQDLSPLEAAQAVFGGFCHRVNNSLMPLNNLSGEDVTIFMKGFMIDFSKPPNYQELIEGKMTEEAIRETARWIKNKIREQFRQLRGEGQEIKIEEWFEKIERASFQLGEKEKQAVERGLEELKKSWVNLERLAEGKPIDPEVPLEEYPGGKVIFDFTKDLTVKDGKS